MRRIVLDTNVLVAAAYAQASASRRIVQACLQGELVAVASPAVKCEYESILARAVRRPGYERQLADLLERMELVEPGDVPRVVPEDPEDDKFLAAAAAGRAGWIITNDQHLLAISTYRQIQILPPSTFAAQLLSPDSENKASAANTTRD
jgi:putative PIN family toxin of toxin-antitoxin system